jgi:hypothetical protein
MISHLLSTDADWTQTVIRMILGIVFFAHGSQKLLGWFGGPGLKGTMHTMHDLLGLPVPLAYLGPWTPCGVCIGWVAGSDLYLDSSASYRVAQQAAGLDRFVASEQTLRRRLHGQGLLVSIDTGRQTLLVRKTLEGCPRHVLHLKASSLVGTITETGANLTL